MSYIAEHFAESAKFLKKLDIDSLEQKTNIVVETGESGGAYFY